MHNAQLPTGEFGESSGPPPALPTRGERWRSLTDLAREAEAEGYKVADEARQEWARGEGQRA